MVHVRRRKLIREKEMNCTELHWSQSANHSRVDTRRGARVPPLSALLLLCETSAGLPARRIIEGELEPH